MKIPEWLTAGVCLLLASIPEVSASDESLTVFDFRKDDHGWHGNARVENLRQDPDEGLVFESGGHDPWIEGPPAENLPSDARLRLTIRMRSTGDPSGEVFYGPSFDAERRVGFAVEPDGDWHDYTVLLPPQQEGSRLRIDPAADRGGFAVMWIKARPLTPLTEIVLARPETVEISEDAESIRMEEMVLRHNGEQWNGFEFLVEGEPMATGLVDDRIGYIADGEAAFLDLRQAAVTLNRTGDTLTIEGRIEDDHGGRWTLRRIFRSRAESMGLEIATRVEVDRYREVFHLPWITLFSGLGTFGENKTQALLPGVEYLGEDEPGSSTKSFEEAQANRRIVEDYKLTSPFMALAHRDRYIGLAWDRSDHPAAVFDSPDRLHESGAHLMALWHPGVGEKRLENEVDPILPLTLEANTPKTLTVRLFGGHGETIIPAVKHYVAHREALPEPPEFEGGAQHAIRLLAAGWLDSAGHDDGAWRHAVWPGFGFQTAAEAPAQMLWLAAHTDNEDLAERLRNAAERGLERLGPGSHYAEAIGHVNRPVAPLLFGRLDNYIQHRLAQAREHLDQFDGDGLRRYVPPADGPDYSRTHWDDHANGHGFVLIESILEAAAFSGHEGLVEDALALLDKQAEHYSGTVPRGAQTWEMPLHTPDILASARMVRSYVLGYKLTGEPEYLEEARYWAWTGVPMIYLDAPTEGPIGLFATIAVLGATNWTAPNWIGQPVQWCGLVYRSAIQELVRVDERDGAFWDNLARGITASGLQQTFPLEDEERRGLLADFTHLKPQRPDGPAISPATVQTHLAELFDLTPWFQCKRVTDSGVLVFAPGGIRAVEHRDGVLTLEIDGWPAGEYTVRLSRLPGDPEGVTWNGEPISPAFDSRLNSVNIRVEGTGTLVLEGL